MAFAELKEFQGKMWGSGPFEEIEALISDMHETLVEALGPRDGESWLDVGCGTGGVTTRAAHGGAEVTGVDLAPALIDTARNRAADDGLDITYEVGDAEDLTFEDASFEVVSSSVGVMFAPDHAAGELARVCAPGGRLGITAWRPDGGVGKFFLWMRQFQPPPPEGVGIPLAWGTEEHVTELLGDAFDLEFAEHDSVLEIESGEAMYDKFAHAFGPVRTLIDNMEPKRREEFRTAFIAFAEEDRVGDKLVQSRTYLLTTGRRKS
jgi:SAM-dependent methyltransferase